MVKCSLQDKCKTVYDEEAYGYLRTLEEATVSMRDDADLHELSQDFSDMAFRLERVLKRRKAKEEKLARTKRRQLTVASYFKPK